MVLKEKIKAVAGDQGINLTVFAEKIGVSYRTLQNYLGEISPPKVSFYTSICEVFGVSADWLLFDIGPRYVPKTDAISQTKGKVFQTSTENPTFVPIQRYEVTASAGHGSEVSVEMPQGVYAFNERWLERRNLNPEFLSVISTIGNSMEPDLYDGDLVLIDHAATVLVDANIYAVRYSGSLYVKRIQHQPGGKVLLISKNKDYPPIEIAHPVADGVEVIGRIVASMHEW